MTQKYVEMDFNVHENSDGLLIEKYQAIPQEFLQSLKQAREESNSKPAGEYHRAASVPQVVAEKWLAEGYDIYREPVSKTLAKLRAENLDYFITTNKQL